MTRKLHKKMGKKMLAKSQHIYIYIYIYIYEYIGKNTTRLKDCTHFKYNQQH
jgi:hypothetical protein